MRRLLQHDGAIARRLEGWEERAEQLELAGLVEAALRDRHHLVAEAGTGVGKSFAYLLPAVLWADAHPGRGPVVVSTRTIALQEQLERKDLPFLRAVLPIEFSAVTAVGRNRYLCLRRMHRTAKDRGLFEDRARRHQLEQIVEWSLTTREGTRMDLPAPVADDVWEEVQAESGNCLQRACPHFEPCHWQRARRRMHQARILVVNHALYMADLALRAAGTSYLPDHEVVIFDEAHHLDRVATEGLGLRLTLGSVLWHLRRLRPHKGEGVLARHGTPRTLVLIEEIAAHAERFFGDLRERIDRQGGGDGVPLGEETLAEPLTGPIGELAEEILERSMAVQELEPRMELTARASGLNALQATVHGLCRPREGSGLVRWLEPGRRSPALRAAPLEVAPILREHLFGRCTSVMVSATLGTAQDPEFTWMRQRLGCGEAATARLGSPFDYRSKVELVLEEALPDPGRDPKTWLREAAERTRARILDNGGRALVLCTSWHAVHRFADALRGPLAGAGIRLLVQGEAAQARLLAAKREEPTSVLLGTDSFWEGIDVPGDALTLVVLTRLPFQTPGHPLTRARLQAIADRGGDPFVDHSLPEAVLKFRQGFGRLVRSARDGGRVVVLDPRARTRSYGRAFLAALPATRTADTG